MNEEKNKPVFVPDDEPEVKDLPTDQMVLQLGPSHPAVHGIVKLTTTVEGETVKDMDAEIGYLHRGFEKMCEQRTWNQNVVFTDRLNYCSAPINNFAYCSTIEQFMGLELPERAVWIRMIFSELSRVADHLTAVTASAMELGGFTHYFYYIHARELLYRIFEKYCGARLTTSMARVGGQPWDLYEGFEADVREKMAEIRQYLEDGHMLVTRNRIFHDRLRGTGVLSKEDAISFGITGPRLRCTGVDYDVRKAMPYWFYDKVEFHVPVLDEGDNYAAYLVRMDEIEQSLWLVEQCLEKIPSEGPVMVEDNKIALPKKSDTYNHIEGLIHHFKVTMEGVQVPAGEYYFAVESPNGEHGYYIVSDGTGTPYRVRARPTCLPQTAAMPTMCIGGMIADIVPTFGSINMIGGELER